MVSPRDHDTCRREQGQFSGQGLEPTCALEYFLDEQTEGVDGYLHRLMNAARKCSFTERLLYA